VRKIEQANHDASFVIFADYLGHLASDGLQDSFSRTKKIRLWLLAMLQVLANQAQRIDRRKVAMARTLRHFFPVLPFAGKII